jgi:hypothetical protein
MCAGLFLITGNKSETHTPPASASHKCSTDKFPSDFLGLYLLSYGGLGESHILVHLVRFLRLRPSRTNTSVSLDNFEQGLPSGLDDRTRGVVEHSELQSKRSNPNARRQLRDLKETAPSPPNHGVNEFLTCPRQAAIVGQDTGCCVYNSTRAEGPMPTRKGSTDTLTPSALYARRCFPNGVCVRERVQICVLRWRPAVTVAVSGLASCTIGQLVYDCCCVSVLC